MAQVNSTKCVVGDSGGGAWNISTADPLISNTAMDRAGVSVGSFHLLTGTGGPRSSFGQGQPQNQGPFNISNSFSTSPTRHPESYLNLSNHDPWDTTVQVPWHSNHDSMRSENSNYQVMNHSALSGPSVMEGPSPFVAIGSGRTLPCPSSLTNQARMLQPNSSIATNQGFWGESNTSNYPSYSPRSSQIEWGFRSNQVSTGSVSPSAIGTADRSNTRASTSDQVSKGNDIYGHLAPSAISPDTTLTRVPSGNLIESSNPAAATLLRLQPNTSFPTAQSNDASSEFSYTHSSYPPRGSLSRSDNPLGSEGTIGGFELYSPLPQLQPAFQATSRRPSNESLPAHRPATLMSSRA
ncbi:hypothetical protein MMC31_002193 [Peltigera leucophlebia]|nr:hypothetical protein [Peltigera leucophlebia]